ncbi:MAG: helix-turn-helix domain-containing protein [Lacticaseibacillus paracasei]|nr:helix-turn-helix domain-containing protein [Lacticaseibacillus paracasei]
MKLLELMEKNDQKKLQLLYYLDQHPNRKLKNSELQDKLQISYYLFKRQTKEIAEDIAAFDLSDFFAIEVTNTTVILHEYHNTNASVFLEHYLKQSLQIKILMTLMHEPPAFNLTEFAEEHFGSYAFMYKRYTALRDTLKGWGIVLSNDGKLTGDELAIRLLLTKIMVVAHIDETGFDDNVRSTLHELLQLLKMTEATPSMSQLIETKAYFLISLVRFQQGHVIATSPEIVDLVRNIRERTLETRKRVIAIYQAHFTASDQTIDSECDYFGTFLAIIGIITSEEIVFPDTIKQHGRAFIQGFEANFDVQLTLSEKANIEYVVNKCLIDVLALPFRSEFFDDHIEVSYFFRMYPEFFDYCQQFVQARSVKLDRNQSKFMFYHCLLTLAANVPLNKVLEPLYVCVDFTLGKEYNTIIERDIKYFSTLNVKVTNEVRPETKLIITDLVNAYHDTDISKVIWLSPPRPEDWENVIEELLDLRLADRTVKKS